MASSASPPGRLAASYKKEATLSPSVRLYWTLRHDGSSGGGTIDLAVAVRIPPAPPSEAGNGRLWIGFGLSDMGGMVGSDMFVHLPAAVEGGEGGAVVDCHGVSYSPPLVDECGQDWTLRGGARDGGEGGWAVVEVSRSLDTGDGTLEDRAFIDDSSPLIGPTKVIVSWGKMEEGGGGALDGLPIRPHGPGGRAKGQVRFFGDGDGDGDGNSDGDGDAGAGGGADPLAPLKDADEEVHHIDLIPLQPFSVPGEVTTYKNFCFVLADFPDLAPDEEAYIVRLENVLSDGERSLVHHMDLHGTADPRLGSDVRLCRTYMDFIHPWEAGSPTTFALPPDVGIPIGGRGGGDGIGGDGGYLGFRVEMHYHNPGRVTGRSDRSGVRVYYTRRKRHYTAGLMLLGDPALELRGYPTVAGNGVGGMRHSFYCPPACFAQDRMGSQPSINVFREVLHMHKSGERMVNVQWDGETAEPKRTTEISRFDFSQGAGYASREGAFAISPGDSFSTICYFRDRGVVFGSGSNQEMCQVFLWYYPKTKATNRLSCNYVDEGSRVAANKTFDFTNLAPVGCEMGYNASILSPDSDLERRAGAGADSYCRSSSQQSPPSTASTWPSLFALTNKKEAENDESYNDVDSSLDIDLNGEVLSNAAEGGPLIRPGNNDDSSCSLCFGGGKPSTPQKTLEEGYSDTEWTCDEMDAYIPLMFSDPDLLYLDRAGLPSCRDFRNTFGAMCGCPSEQEVVNPGHSQGSIILGPVLLIVSLASAFVIMGTRRLYWRRERQKQDSGNRSEEEIEIIMNPLS